MNPALELIHARKSVRSYEPRPVEAPVKEALLAATLRAPTAGNMMLYTILDITDPGIKEKLSHTCDEQRFIATAPIVLIFLADYQRWMDYYAYSGALEAEGPRPRESDLLLAFSDAMIAAQTTVLAAESLGLGSCYIGDVMEHWETHRDLLDLAPYTFPAAMLTLGYPTAQQKARPAPGRFPLSQIVQENRYVRRTGADFETLFGDRGSGPFLPGATNFGQHEYRRKFSAEFSREMRRSVAVALENWKGLEP